VRALVRALDDARRRVRAPMHESQPTSTLREDLTAR